MALDDVMKMLHTMGRVLSGNDEKKFGENLKESVRQIRTFADEYKDYIKLAEPLLTNGFQHVLHLLR